MSLDALTDRITATEPRGKRRVIALCGPPASGKSTLAAQLSAQVAQSCVVPMDGFHLDNRILRTSGTLDRKGAPETFDISGLSHILRRLLTEDEVIFPVFDRAQDCAIAGAGLVAADTQTVIVEGNYLLLDRLGWRDLATFWDCAVYLSVPTHVLRERLLDRWRNLGLSEHDAQGRADGNDLRNAAEMADHLIAPDVTLDENLRPLG